MHLLSQLSDGNAWFAEKQHRGLVFLMSLACPPEYAVKNRAPSAPIPKEGRGVVTSAVIIGVIGELIRTSAGKRPRKKTRRWSLAVFVPSVCLFVRKRRDRRPERALPLSMRRNPREAEIETRAISATSSPPTFFGEIKCCPYIVTVIFYIFAYSPTARGFN